MTTSEKPHRPELYIQTDASCHVWDGLSSSKFRHNQRKHYSPRDVLNSMVESPSMGRRHFSPRSPTTERVEKSTIRTFPCLNNTASTPIEYVVKPRPVFTPSPKKYGLAQRRHLYQERSKEYVYSPSIRVYPDKEKPYKGKEIFVEDLMQRKKMVDSLEDQRNFIGLRSLGDKPYKSPDYSPRFFHEGGLVVGSTNKPREATKSLLPLPSPTQTPTKKIKKLSILEQEKMSERMAEINSVRSLGSWEKANLERKDSKILEPVNPSFYLKPNFRVKKSTRRVIFKD